MLEQTGMIYITHVSKKAKQIAVRILLHVICKVLNGIDGLRYDLLGMHSCCPTILVSSLII